MCKIPKTDYYQYSEGILAEYFEDKNGLLTGEYVEYWDNGNTKYIGTYDKGLPIAVHYEYHDTGEIGMGYIYKDGFLNGDVDGWYRNGNKKLKGQYVDDARSGHWQYFHADGWLHREGLFVEDKRKGEWLEYDKLGNIVSRTNHGE